MNLRFPKGHYLKVVKDALFIPEVDSMECSEVGRMYEELGMFIGVLSRILLLRTAKHTNAAPTPQAAPLTT